MRNSTKMLLLKTAINEGRHGMLAEIGERQ
jgi:hypothetical protein